jgi:hypothetical protein
MHRRNDGPFARYVCAAVAAMLIWAASSSINIAQVGLPKVPGIPKGTKKETKPNPPQTPEINPSPGGTVEVLSTMSPDAAPPGGMGEVVVTGDLFNGGKDLEFRCQGAEFKPDSIKVESPKRIVARIHVPVSAQEGPCGTSLRSLPGKEPFRISKSASMPIGVEAHMLGEGDMQFFELMMKMQQAMMPGFGNQAEAGQILLAPTTIKFVEGGKTIFTEPATGVKSMSEMKQAGQPIGIFRIVFNDGKIYNFMGAKAGAGESHQTFELLRTKLGK